MDYIKIKGYKSIKKLTLKLSPINILIGANGAGKSNFISFFELLNKIYNRNLKEYVALGGGAEKLLHKGSKMTKEIETHISFDDETNGYSLKMIHGAEGFFFQSEQLWYSKQPWDIANAESEARVKIDGLYRAKYVTTHLNGLKKHHFHETGKDSPFTQMAHKENDSHFLYEKGENLAAFLYMIQQEHPIVYARIVRTVQSVAPYFSDFFLLPNATGYLRLHWQDKYTDTVYGASDLSDGTVRFIALTTLFMQPNLPTTLVIDEPELGLHPFTIGKLAGLIQSVAAKGTQVIIATQSTDLVNHFEPHDIITVDQRNGESTFTRLKDEELALWLDDYTTIGDLWQKSIIQNGQP